jgi:hypothetical protein
VNTPELAAIAGTSRWPEKQTVAIVGQARL